MAVWPHNAIETEVQTAISTFRATIAGRPIVTPFRRSMSADLNVANSTRQAAILGSTVLADCALVLGAMKAIGCDAVAIGLSFPIIDPAFPSYAAYRQRYIDIMALCRSLGFRVIIETVFIQNNPAFGSFDYSNYTKAQMLAGNVTHNTWIWNNLQPDVQICMSEPGTMNALVAPYLNGAEVFYPVDFAQNATDIMAQISGRSARRQFGIGVGSWEDASWYKAFLNTDIDIIDVHVYPAYNLAQLVTIADAAYARGIDVGIGEAGAYIEGSAEGSQAGTSGTVYQRALYEDATDTHIAYADMLVDVASKCRISYVSHFFVHDWFATLPYSDANAALTTPQAMNAVDAMAYPRYATNTWTAFGSYWKTLCTAAALTRPRTADTTYSADTARVAR